MRYAFPIAVLLLALTPSAHATPAHDEVVATNLLPRSAKQAVAALASRVEEDAVIRLARVRTLLQAGRADGDPRTLGVADALLAGIAETDEVLVLRATIEQSRHRFDAARVLLDKVLQRQPRHPQALLTRATIAAVTGDYVSAAADCLALRAVHIDAAAICGAQVDATSGANARATQVLALAVRRTDGPLRAWALALQGQLAEQRDDAPNAIAAYRASLQHADELSTRLALADVLLEQHAFGAADRLLADSPPADGVLLRRWLSARAQGRAADDLKSQLAQRFADAEQRGELLHAREAAIFALACGEHRRALAWARQNWQAQRESVDLIVLIRAARAARDRTTEREATEWLKRTGLTDVRVNRALGLEPGNFL